jgi:hypothetical protein
MPCQYDITRNFVSLSCLIYPRECHLYSCQSLFRYWSLRPMEAASIDVEHDKCLLHPQHLMKLSEKGIRWLMQHDGSRQSALSPMHRRKGCMRDRDILLLLIVPISSFLYNQCIIHRFLCFPPPFINFRTRFLLRGEGCDTPYHQNTNYPH